jgi:GTP pyrophosphokinase
LWKCCDWKIAKKIVAHINRDSKITIHRRDCEIIKDVNKDRLLSAYELANQWECLEVNIILTVLNKKWILKSISDIIYTMEINIEEINFSKKFRSQYKWDISLTLEVSDYDYLIIDRLIDRIKNCLWDDLVWFKLKNIK